MARGGSLRYESNYAAGQLDGLHREYTAGNKLIVEATHEQAN
ncbi:MAG: hypothetical protein R3F17_14010 [Planctomycetota bacterium]